MANKSRTQRRANQRKAAKVMSNKGFLENLSENIKKKAAEVQAQQEAELGPGPDDLNVLPLPDTQESVSGGLEWTWKIGNTATVVAFLATGGDYDVSLLFGKDISGKHTTFDGDEAKTLGHALISAWNYHNVWKLHAGEFIERQLGLVSQPATLEVVKDIAVQHESGELSEDAKRGTDTEDSNG